MTRAVAEDVKGKSVMTGTQASKAISRIVAGAIRQTRKFNAAEHTAVMAKLMELGKTHPDYMPEIADRMVVMGNRSAFAKDLAKAGLVSEGDASAFAREIGEAVDAIAADEKAEVAKMTKTTK